LTRGEVIVILGGLFTGAIVENLSDLKKKFEEIEVKLNDLGRGL